jgi:hypothetical protein
MAPALRGVAAAGSPALSWVAGEGGGEGNPSQAANGVLWPCFCLEIRAGVREA